MQPLGWAGLCSLLYYYRWKLCRGALAGTCLLKCLPIATIRVQLIVRVVATEVGSVAYKSSLCGTSAKCETCFLGIATFHSDRKEL